MKQGFTLIEVLIASLIFSVVLIVASAAFVGSSRLTLGSEAVRETTDQSRYAMEVMAGHIRQARSFTINSVNETGASITVTALDSTQTTFDVQNDAVTMTQAGVSNPLTDRDSVRVSDLTFSRAINADVEPYVTISFVATPVNANRPETLQPYTLQTTVSLRNFQ